MACFLVSAAEAAIVKVAEKGVEKEEIKSGADTSGKIALSKKLSWLTYMLLGGAVLLMFEHLWHGEVTPFFPFLTAMSDPEDTREMLYEMATTGVCMALAVTGVWGIMCAVADRIVKRTTDDLAEVTEEA